MNESRSLDGFGHIRGYESQIEVNGRRDSDGGRTNSQRFHSGFHVKDVTVYIMYAGLAGKEYSGWKKPRVNSDFYSRGLYPMK